ncbi:TPA_asm: HAD family hydrolase, partial [Listeria monocytogenes]|nr:HAD family hydrolase [Listeria monocytogenes]HEM1670348.1 HAD family hydrolase [Listeria monocytogenes]
MINLIFDIDDTVYDQLKPFENAFKTVFGKA